MRSREWKGLAQGHTANSGRQGRDLRLGSSWPPLASGTPVPASLLPTVPEEQVSIGLEVLDGGCVYKAEAEHRWGWGPAEHTHNASWEGHSQLPSHSSQAAG